MSGDCTLIYDIPPTSGCYCAYDTISVDAAVASLNLVVQDDMKQAVYRSFNIK
jgi:hypothetical protein